MNIWIVLFAAVAAGGASPAGAARETVFPGRQWDETSPAEQSVDPAALHSALQYLEGNAGSDGIGEVVVVRNGYVIYKGDRVDKMHGVWSCTKSFTSTVLGLLIDDGRCRLDTAACSVVPELKANYSGITLWHLATMTSGYWAEGDKPQGGYTHGPSRTPFRPGNTPLFAPPGSKYAYWDSAMNLFGLVLTRIAGESMEELFRRRIADPIGMDPKYWDWGDYSVDRGVVVNGGSGNQGKHIFISASQMARFGLLFLNRGKWKDRQLISAEWVDAATSVQVPAETPLGHLASGFDGRGCYGLNWWVNGTRPGGAPKWPKAPPRTFAALGHNNNALFVVPEWRMVIVRLGLDQKDRKITDEVWSGFFERLGSGVR